MKIPILTGFLTLITPNSTHSKPILEYFTAKKEKCHQEQMLLDFPQGDTWIVVCDVCPNYDVMCTEVKIN